MGSSRFRVPLPLHLRLPRMPSARRPRRRRRTAGGRSSCRDECAARSGTQRTTGCVPCMRGGTEGSTSAEDFGRYIYKPGTGCPTGASDVSDSLAGPPALPALPRNTSPPHPPSMTPFHCHQPTPPCTIHHILPTVSAGPCPARCPQLAVLPSNRPPHPPSITRSRFRKI